MWYPNPIILPWHQSTEPSNVVLVASNFVLVHTVAVDGARSFHFHSRLPYKFTYSYLAIRKSFFRSRRAPAAIKPLQPWNLWRQLVMWWAISIERMMNLHAYKSFRFVLRYGRLLRWLQPWGARGKRPSRTVHKIRIPGCKSIFSLSIVLDYIHTHKPRWTCSYLWSLALPSMPLRAMLTLNLEEILMLWKKTSTWKCKPSCFWSQMAPCSEHNL